jgi:hypothetical protein
VRTYAEIVSLEYRQPGRPIGRLHSDRFFGQTEPNLAFLKTPSALNPARAFGFLEAVTLGPSQDPRLGPVCQYRERAAMQPEHLKKIRNICDSLVAAGFRTLDKQAEVLGLPRSTTWSILHGNHKKSGLSAGLVTRMLRSRVFPLSETLINGPMV